MTTSTLLTQRLRQWSLVITIGIQFPSKPIQVTSRVVDTAPAAAINTTTDDVINVNACWQQNLCRCIKSQMQCHTLMPAERHLVTASGTAARGGSIIDNSPTNRSPVSGKFSSSASNLNPGGNCVAGRLRSQNPRTRSPRPPSSRYASLKAFRHSSVNGRSSPCIRIVEQRSKMRSGAPFMTRRYWHLSVGSWRSWIDT